ncbi:MAG: CinA family protein [Chloroflexi bacterium]|nr:CinA family protein [Chloroflexota bacterium]
MLADELKAVFTEKGLTLATAESCTGGLLGAAITSVPGSSAYYMGGVISYANSAKIDLLGVDPDVLEQAGAVSIQTAEEMARGARERFKVDGALSITGIAGPGGGTEEKPVGLTFMALAEEGRITIQRLMGHGSREENRNDAVEIALKWLIEWAQTY